MAMSSEILTIGDHIEALHLALLPSAGDDAYSLAERVAVCLQSIEEHDAVLNLGESAEVVTELTLDCRKKAAHVLRAPFTKSISSLISSTRKRLIDPRNTKPSGIEGDMASYPPGERHFHLLMEVLGTWSNTIMQISELGLSLPTFHAVALPLHARVIECALECFEQFRKDKKLDSWHERVMVNPHHNSSSSGSSNDNGKGNTTVGENITTASGEGAQAAAAFSIITLDGIVKQVAAIREVVGKYYAFLDNFSIVTENEGSSTLSANNPTVQTLYPAEEQRRWRELDMIYLSLESGYMTHALHDALDVTRLVEVQTGIYVPQLIEDVFFVFSRVLDRSISTSVESIMLAIAMKIVQYTDYDSLMMAGSSGEEEDGSTCPIYRLLSCKRCFLHSYRNMAVTRYKTILKEYGSDNSNSRARTTPPTSIYANSDHSSSNNNVTSNSSTGRSPDSTSVEQKQKLKEFMGDDLGEELGNLVETIGLDKLVTNVGNSGWFAAISSIAISATSRSPTGSGSGMVGTSASASAPTSGGGSGNATRNPTTPSAKSSQGSLLDALIAGVEADAGVTADAGAYTVGETVPESSPSSGSGIGKDTSLQQILDPLLFYDDFHLHRDGSYRTILSAISAVAEVVTADEVVVYERHYRLNMDAQQSAAYVNVHKLTLTDWAVAFNACTATVSSLMNLQRIYESSMRAMMATNSANAASKSAANALHMINSELRRVGKMYEQLMYRDMQCLFFESFEKHVGQPLSIYVRARRNVKKVPLLGHSQHNTEDGHGATPSQTQRTSTHYRLLYMSVNYEVNGDAMEKQAANSHVIRLVSRFVYNEVADDDENGLTGGSKMKTGLVAKNTKTVALFSSKGGDAATDRERADADQEQLCDVSILSHYLRPHCSSRTYIAALHIFAEYLHRHLLYEVMLSMQFNEWGALLFHKEVYACIMIFERAVDVVYAGDPEGASAGADAGTTNTAVAHAPSSMSPNGKIFTNNSTSGTSTLRTQFLALMWILKLLTLDSVGDVGRYKIPLSVFKPYVEDIGCLLAISDARLGVTSPSPAASAATSSNDNGSRSTKTLSAIVLDRFLRAVLARRTDFSADAISKAKLQLM